MRNHPWRLLFLRCHSRSQLHISRQFSHLRSHPTPLPYFSSLLRPRALRRPDSKNPDFRFFSSSELAVEDKDSDLVLAIIDFFSNTKKTTDEITSATVDGTIGNLELESRNILVTHELVTKVLQSLTEAPDVARRFFDLVNEWERLRLNFKNSVEYIAHPKFNQELIGSKSYNVMLDILGANGYVEDFWDLVGIMKKRAFGVAKGTHARVLEKFEKDGLDSDVERLKRLYGSGSGSIDNSAEKQACLQVCRVIREEVWGDEVEKLLRAPNIAYSSNSVVMILENHHIGGQPNKALIFFRWIQESNLFEHDERTYNAMVRVLGREDCIGKFWKMVDEMRGAGYEMENKTYIKVLGRFIDRKMVKDAVDLYECAMGCKNKPSVQDCTFLLRKVAVSKELDMNLFLKVVKTFTEGGNVLTSSAVEPVLKSLTSVGRLGECNKILKAMEEGGFLPNGNLQSKIAFQFSSKGKKEEASKFKKNLGALSSNSNPKAWASLVEGHCVAGALNEAAASFRSMVKKEGTSCSGYPLELLISAYCAKNRATDACKLLIDLVGEKELKPWHSTYKVLISKLMVQGGFNEALNILGLMKSHGFPPFLDPFIEYVSKTGTADEAMMFLNAMTVKRFPSRPVFLQVFEAHMKAGRHNEAQNLLSKCPSYIRNNADILDLFFTMKSEAAAAATS